MGISSNTWNTSNFLPTWMLQSVDEWGDSWWSILKACNRLIDLKLAMETVTRLG